MRAIDADALESDLFDADWTLDNDEHMVQDILRKQPTLDVVPVRHGRWIPMRPYIYSVKCTICGKIWELETPYCPSCGAKMDLEE